MRRVYQCISTNFYIADIGISSSLVVSKCVQILSGTQLHLISINRGINILF